MIYRLIRTIALVAFTGISIAGCGSERIVSAPGGGPQDRATITADRGGTRPAAASHGQLVACQRHPASHGSAVIGPSGGTLQVGTTQLIIPPGALNRWVLISGTVAEGTEASVTFEPAGLEFRKPAGLVFAVEGCDIPAELSPKVLYIDDDGAVLEEIEAIYLRALKRVAAPLWHFSRYALAV